MNLVYTHKEIISLVDSIDVIKYAKTRNHLTGAISRISPYLTRGVITLPEVRDRILLRYTQDQASKFLQELAWREYFQKVWLTQGDKIFLDLRFSRTDWNHDELITNIIEGSTGIDVIDHGISDLYKDGYIHNHLRMWIASISCNLGKSHWLSMSKWMYANLLDGDLASNTLSWQWVAGTSKAEPYTCNQQLINACSESNQSSTFLSFERENMLVQPLPPELTEHEPLALKMPYPESTTLPDLSSQKVFLYTPHTLNSQWRNQEEGLRVLIFDTTWHDRFPIAQHVVDFVLEIARQNIPGIKIFVGNPQELFDGNPDIEFFSNRHPMTLNYPGVQDSPEELFPDVQDYHKSFFSFWKACEKTITH